MEYLITLSAFILGGILGWYINSLKNRSSCVPISEKKRLENEIAELQRQHSVNEERVNHLNQQLEGIKGEKADLQKAFDDLKEEKLKVENQNQTLLRSTEERQKELVNTKKELHTEFQNLAHKILNKNSEQFKKENKEQLNNLLDPLNKDIEKFRKKVEDVYDKESQQRASLKKEVKNLMEMSQQVKTEANELAEALKGSSRSKMQGDWGETILRRILENSDLREGSEYHIQSFLEDDEGKKLRNEEGKRMQPDVIIEYPDDRKIIIDSKVSLTAYANHSAADTDEERKRYLDQHLASIRKHIDDLSRKKYQAYTSSLDFVMMFIPNEASYSTAIENDPGLWEYAYNRRVVLITPTNLIAALKLISDLWKREYQNQNAQRIAEKGQKLYDKFKLFVDNLEDIGKRLDKTKEVWDNAYKQLRTGRGNLIKQAEDLKALGIQPNKEIKYNSDIDDDGSSDGTGETQNE